MRSSLALICLAAVPATVAFAACSPVMRDFGTGAGGGSGASTTSTGSPASATGATTTGTGGTGTGGAAVTGNCTPSGTVFTVIDSTTLAGNALDDKPVIVVDPGTGHAMVHVVVNSKTNGAIFVRSLTSDPTMAVANLASFGGFVGAGPSSFEATGGWVLEGGGGSLFVQGFGGPNQSFGQVIFPIDASKGVLPNPTSSNYPTPPDCMPANHPGRSAFVRDPAGGVHYVTSCEIGSTTPPSASTWIGTDTGTPVQLGAGASTDLAMNPSSIDYVGQTAIISYMADTGLTAGYSFGPDSAMGPVSTLTLEAGKAGLLLGTAPTSTSDGFTLFAGSIAPDMSSASLWSGAAAVTDLAAFTTAPTSFLKQYFTASTPTAITATAAFTRPTFDSGAIYGAGATFADNAVNFSWFQRDGTPLVTEQQVYTTGTYTVIAAGAAPLGLPKVVVVWIEEDGASPPNFQVRGQLLLCLQNG